VGRVGGALGLALGRDLQLGRRGRHLARRKPPAADVGPPGKKWFGFTYLSAWGRPASLGEEPPPSTIFFWQGRKTRFIEE
jgi:hypothetical protein